MKLFLAIIAGITLIVAACADDADEVVPEDSPSATTASGTARATIPSGTSSPSPTVTAQPTTSPEPTPAPSAGFDRYSHPSYGFSFEYPTSWFLYGGEPIPSGSFGGVISVTSFELSKDGGPGQRPVSEARLDITPLPNPQLLSLAQWLATSDPATGDRLVGEESVEIDGRQGTMRTAVTSSGTEYRQYFLAASDYVVFVAAFAESEGVRSQQTIDIVYSLRFPDE